MPQIEIDDETFSFLQARARPFVDTPGSLVRRLLLGKTSAGAAEAGDRPTRSEALTRCLLASFRGPFEPVGRFRLLLESPTDLVYVQNFDKDSDRQWFRVHEKPWQILLGSVERRRCTLALVNPARRQAYLLPVVEIARRAAAAGWRRPSLEINIDGRRHRWAELGWQIGAYRATLEQHPPALDGRVGD